MTDHPAAAAAALIRELAETTTDPREAYGSPAEIASVAGSLLDLARHLEDALRHLERHMLRRDDDWATTDGERPGRYAREASGAIQSAQAEARNMARALARSVEALSHLKPAP
ncbi:hypothetical protein OG429_12745 [Streptomyces sp. NBC_00190]|uniref:DUF6197 family protein n=1 Tax=unclassified Streptomyces TaxID=2593676 RepID=UPI002E2D92CF|nr:hypothetical protein [Streptomyces sp. NBC_00190]WSZ40139.1 hypothetical protein OG239_15755 [Streptomyces sp. NBC_00868]